MHLNIDVSIVKLSAPVEALNIDRRAWRTLQRASVYTVAEIVLRGKPQPGSIKNMGPLMADRIWRAVARYLELPEEKLAGEPAAPAGSRCEVWEAPVSALPLHPSTVYTLARLGYLRIDDLVKARANQYKNLPGVGAHELFEIDQKLHRFLARAAQAHLLGITGTDTSLESESLAAPPVIFPLPGLPKHAGPFWNAEPCS
jgi:DNA-directed RNA polymerase alpha subunit